MKTKVRHWLRLLIASFITGMSTSFLTSAGISGAEMVGVKVQQLSMEQLVATTLFGGVVGLFAYLKQSPMPPDDEP